MIAVDLPDLPDGLPCPLRTVTGLDCPLCGATRATFALLRADIPAALDFNALYVIALPALAAIAITWLARRRAPGAAGASRPLIPSPIATRALLAIALAYTIVRNLPFAPFDYLGTT